MVGLSRDVRIGKGHIDVIELVGVRVTTLSGNFEDWGLRVMRCVSRSGVRESKRCIMEE